MIIDMKSSVMFCFLFYSLNLFSQETIKGTVKYRGTGEAITHKKIRICKHENDTACWTGETNEKGEFKIECLGGLNRVFDIIVCIDDDKKQQLKTSMHISENKDVKVEFNFLEKHLIYYNKGFQDGIKKGKDEGYALGFKEGKKEGYNHGVKNGEKKEYQKNKIIQKKAKSNFDTKIKLAGEEFNEEVEKRLDVEEEYNKLLSKNYELETYVKDCRCVNWSENKDEITMKFDFVSKKGIRFKNLRDVNFKVQVQKLESAKKTDRWEFIKDINTDKDYKIVEVSFPRDNPVEFTYQSVKNTFRQKALDFSGSKYRVLIYDSFHDNNQPKMFDIDDLKGQCKEAKNTKTQISEVKLLIYDIGSVVKDDMVTIKLNGEKILNRFEAGSKKNAKELTVNLRDGNNNFIFIPEFDDEKTKGVNMNNTIVIKILNPKNNKLIKKVSLAGNGRNSEKLTIEK